MEENKGLFVQLDIDAIPKYKDITPKMIEDAIRESMIELEMLPPTRQVKMYTGPGGMDLFEEMTELTIGLKRIYIGKKVPSFLRRLKYTIKRSHTRRYFKLVKIKQEWLNPEDNKEGID